MEMPVAPPTIPFLHTGNSCNILFVPCSHANVLQPNLATPKFRDNLAFYRLAIPEELIYPVNGKTPEEVDHEVAGEVRRAIMKMCSKDRVKIPLPWFVFEQLIRELTAKKGVEVLSIAECWQVALRLRMSRQMFLAALGYLVDLNFFFYYPESLPNVVFCNSQDK